MGPIFWVVVAICYVGIVLLGVINVGGFLLRYRAGLNPPRTQLVRGVLILAVFFVFPRILHSPWLWTVASWALILWEVATWMRGEGLCREKTRPLINNQPPLTNGPA
jgi:hypothetical protein